jgi:hypothetical protein
VLLIMGNGFRCLVAPWLLCHAGGARTLRHPLRPP